MDGWELDFDEETPENSFAGETLVSRIPFETVVFAIQAALH